MPYHVLRTFTVTICMSPWDQTQASRCNTGNNSLYIFERYTTHHRLSPHSENVRTNTENYNLSIIQSILKSII